MIYPTKEKIINKLPKIKVEVLQTVKLWKKEEWKAVDKESENDKFLAIRILLGKLDVLYNDNLENVKLTDHQSAFYVPSDKTIYLKNPQSIISALHEFAHHTYGSSELQACRWSVSIFSKTFPIAFKKLKWQGHMLVKGD